MVKGWGSEGFLRYNALNEVKGWSMPPPPPEGLFKPPWLHLHILHLTIYQCSHIHEKTTCIFEVIAGSAFSVYKPMVTSSCHSNQSLVWTDKLKKMCIISTLLSIHVASFMRKEHVVFKFLKDPLFPIISQWKLQVAIATNFLVGLTK